MDEWMRDPVRLLWALVALAVVAPALACLASSLVPLVAVVTVAAIVIRLVWARTRP
jgi:hypothetical protein